MNTPMHEYRGRHAPHQPCPQLHLHSPTLDAVIERLCLVNDVSCMHEAIRLVDAMRPPMAITTMGDLFAHVDAFEDENENEERDDGCEICGVRCSSTAHAPYPGLCVRCTAKVQHLQMQKRPPQQKGGGELR
ncbi:hypothetical protein DES53_11560 [Roseimicrobium gellanilyticum]|uniref:Uncharacterized protein n=1 Tax=Roseimicrobium gellanilyticum TaxID=748857 RepID=A0A366H4S9_9BACT|nr:hypothetical protein [Roseimicrobium gellanilyticum]RBP36919.1 hypothetical protein DES53_11560 [Roseimicrobium gellanilyticum]